MSARWWRRILIGLALALLGFGTLVFVEYRSRWIAQGELDDAIATLDRTDPGWRLDAVEADRQPVATEQNAAPLTVSAHALLPKNWDQRTLEELDTIPPPIDLSNESAEKLDAQMHTVQAALKIARPLEHLPFGRQKIQFTPDFLSTLVPDQTNVRTIGKLLELDVYQAVYRKDMVQAWHSNRALLNAARSLGDEPLLISMLIRMTLDVMAVRSLERILAQEQLPAADLEERQRALEEERAVAFFLIGIRGERAGNDLLLTNIETGRIGLMQTLESAGRANKAEPTTAWQRFNEFFAMSMVLRSHTTLLLFETRLVEAAKLPAEQRYEAIRAIDASFRAEIADDDRSQILARLLFPGVVKLAEVEQRIHTHLACGETGMAAERYRLRMGKWPDSLDDLVRIGFLRIIPADLVDGNPLRFRRTTDGIVIYSIGKDQNYDGTALDDLAQFDSSAIRTEFRLWDLAHRRQKPLPRPKDQELP